KLFFVGAYEGLRLNAPAPQTKTVPTQSLRNKAAAANANGVVGYMAQFWNAYPLPDGNPTTDCTTAANCVAAYTASFPGTVRLDASSVRADYIINSKMNIFGRWSHTPSVGTTNNSVTTTKNQFLNDVYTAGWSTVLSNTLT